MLILVALYCFEHYKLIDVATKKLRGHNPPILLVSIVADPGLGLAPFTILFSI